MKYFNVVRMYFNDELSSEVIKSHVTIEDAQIHCRDQETSSSTCEGITGIERTAKYGAWFDGYVEVK